MFESRLSHKMGKYLLHIKIRANYHANFEKKKIFIFLLRLNNYERKKNMFLKKKRFFFLLILCFKKKVENYMKFYIFKNFID